MSEPSQQSDLEELISSAEGSPVSLGVSPGSSEARKMTATSGRSWLPLLKSYGLDGSLGKMCEALLTNRWASSAAFLTWKASGIKPRHLLFQLAPSMPRTDAIGSGLWPTPTLNDTRPNRDIEKQLKRNTLGLAEKVKMWPTPRSFSAMAAIITEKTTRPEGYRGNLEEAVARTMWPTPTASAHKDTGGPAKLAALAENGRETLARKVAAMSLLPTPTTMGSSMYAEKNAHMRNTPGLASVAKLWPTPNASDNKDRGNLSMPSIQRRQRIGKQLNLSMVVSEESGALNPEWVEWIMGFPAGWTNLTADEL